MKRRIPLLALATCLAFLVTGCIVINVERGEKPPKPAPEAPEESGAEASFQ